VPRKLTDARQTHTTQIYARGVSAIERRYLAELPGYRMALQAQPQKQG
jgi:hypothetical protein